MTTDTATPPVDTAALAANDKDLTPTLGDHLEAAQAAVTEQPAAAGDGPADSPATIPEPPPEIPTQREADLQRRLTAAEERLRYYEERRGLEQSLLAERDSHISAIESAKMAKASAQKELAETEARIAALLKQPLPQAFESTPIGQAIAAAEGEAAAPAAPPPTPWESILPAVGPESVKLLDAAAGDELPTVDALCGALLAPQAMMGGKRVLKQSVQVYGTPWIVTHLWKDEASGACRANVVRLYTKDEWQQSCEAKYGRAVGDFDQSDEAKAQRQVGGEWCGLTVKVSRKSYVVGPQADALHLAYLPPEPAQEPAETAQPAAEGAQEPAKDTQDEPWPEVAARAIEIIEATGMTAAAYAMQYKLPYIALSKLLSTGIGPEDAAVAEELRKAFPPFDDEDGEDEDGNED